MHNFSINIPMLRRRFWRLLGNKSFNEVCSKKWEISPTSISMTPPAISLSGEIEKIKGYESTTSREQEQLRIHGGRREHAATIGRLIRGVELSGDHIYKKSAKMQIGIKPEKILCKNQKFTEIDTAALACSWSDTKYFGHWVTDGVSLLMAAHDLAPPIRNSELMTMHQKQYLSILEMSYSAFNCGRVRELIILEDFGQNKYKRQRYEKIRETFCSSKPEFSHPGVIILRGTSGTDRTLVNEVQVANYLLSIGFRIIDPQCQSAGEIVAAIRGARIVVGVEGSHLAHGLFSMGPEGTLLVLQPPYRFNNVHKDYTDCMDLKYSFMLGEPCDGGFSISLDNLKKTLDLIF
jgi:hypothetical protein